ncbi:MAG TPA: 4Fe-4S dicluster domain-containing protein [Anaeromyxobacteraceae bacterium]|nr:4Fe-4S dicluster domain-containing protein [Anaeromyxobacteraceae bacterium]
MMDRRTFLHTLGLLTGGSALSACTPGKDRRHLVSALVPPEDGVVPGQSVWHATTCTECPAGCGMQVRLREGRPVKAEGVPGHPVSGGGLCVRGQASLWRLYDPRRLRGPQVRDGGALRAATWDDALSRVASALAEARGAGRTGAYLSGRTTGALAALLAESAPALGLEWLPRFEPFSHAAIRRANGLLFGAPEVPRLDAARPDVLLTVGADLLETFVSPVGLAAQVVAGPAGRRWWHAEPHCSLTGANADRRLVLRAGSEPWLLAWLLARVAPSARRPLPPAVVAAMPRPSIAATAEATGVAVDALEALGAALAAAKEPLVVAGAIATAAEGGLAVAGLAALLQWTLGATGRTVDLARGEGYGDVGSLLDLRALGERLERGQVGVLFVARANPVRHAPAAWRLAGKLAGATLRVGLGDLMDETLREMDVVLPLSHPLETWEELAPRRGLRELLRPAAAPLGDTRAEGDVLLELRRRAGETVAPSYQERLMAGWRARYDDAALRAYSAAGWAEEPVSGPPVGLDAGAAAELLRGVRLSPPKPGLVLVLAPSIRSFDGRSRALQLLEEVPDPLTTVTYGPWISVAPGDARRLGVADGDELRVTLGGWSAELPAKLQPGLAEGVFVVQRDVLPSFPGGMDPATGEAICALPGPGLERTGRGGRMPYLSGSPSQQGRGLIPEPIHRKETAKRASLYPEHPHPEHRWTMAIDVSRCIGCGACAASCYVENDVPVTGAREHRLGREMSWLRIEPFYDAAGGVDFLPILCQQCHAAPCEPVCPVYAAYHNPEGLNVQVYNRCIGTRYCSNNCPYKVRRFNWFDPVREAPLDLLHNPDLSARGRGIMEKCTFCVQRITAARDRAKDEGRAVRDGEVVPACAQSCPTTAIVFGDLNDAGSRIAALVKAPGSWRVFEELGTEPSVHYHRGGGEGER